jgi:WLM domain
MQEHEFGVGTLTELAPHEHPNLLGLNKNAGEVILLRLRTDAYDGFRLYADIRRVLCHELTHNVWGDHDDNVWFIFHAAPPKLTVRLVQSTEFKTKSRGG